jgi:hypothetical protein
MKSLEYYSLNTTVRRPSFNDYTSTSECYKALDKWLEKQRALLEEFKVDIIKDEKLENHPKAKNAYMYCAMKYIHPEEGIPWYRNSPNECSCEDNVLAALMEIRFKFSLIAEFMRVD